MTVTRHFALAAGGTGGHMMPAFALASELMARGHRAILFTDERGAKIPGTPDGLEVHVLPAGRLGGGPLGYLRAAKGVWQGRAKSIDVLRAFAPAAVIGFGGYPAFPALLGARALKIRTLIHDQNAVLGRVNRLLARSVDVIATAYDNVERVPESAKSRVVLVGNPVRAEVLALRTQGFPPLEAEGDLHLLVTGGSQGARIFSEVIPEALSLLPLSLRQRLRVIQQCRPEDIDQVRGAYADYGIPAELMSFIEDMPNKLRWSQLVIARGGASTIAELTCAGRPAILVPLPSATDDHQTYNVREMVKVGGGKAIAQTQFTPVTLASEIQAMVAEPGALETAATAALSVGRPNATQDLADLLDRPDVTPLMDVIRMGGKATSAQIIAGASA